MPDSDYLLVPTNVQALVVTKPGVDKLFDLVPTPRTHDDLAKWYVNGKSSFYFENDRLSALEAGVHLHWAIPDALTHTVHRENQPPQQPCIPNRWLVQRLWHTPPGDKISSREWVVNSDSLSANPSSGVPFPFFSASSADLKADLKFVGSQTELRNWKEVDPQYQFELKSSGWGDPCFASYYPACNGVLGFHDPLEDFTKGYLTYSVIGWYSDPARDPLAGKESFAVKLAALRWSCVIPDNAPKPNATLCHGGVVGIQLPSTGTMSPVIGRDMKVSIGCCAADAFAALIAPADASDGVQQVLRAFQYVDAQEVQDLYDLGAVLHSQGFSTVPGGKRWLIQPIEQSPASGSKSASSKTPSPSPGALNLLNDLNKAQQTLDQQSRSLDSLRWRLFACWVTWARKQSGPPLQRPSRDKLPVATDLDDAKREMKSAQEAVDTCKQTLIAALSNSGLQLTESTMPPFLYPKDPFVAIESADLAGPDRTRPQRSIKDADGLLSCRLGSQVVSKVMATSGGVQKEYMVEFDFPDKTRLPFGDIANKLALETLLLDPNCSLTGIQDLQLFQQLPRTDQTPAPSTASNIVWTNQPPDPLAVTCWEKNPWLPVYLLWQVHWSAESQSPNSPLYDWQIDAEPLAVDLLKKAPRFSDQVTLTGATIISELSGALLARNLDTLHVKLSETLSGIKDKSFLGQSLGGFNDMLRGRTLGLCLPPIDPNQPIDAKKTTATIDQIWMDMYQQTPTELPFIRSFFPVSAGSLNLVNLCVIDTFGQARKLIDSDRSSTASVIISAALKPAQQENQANFSPRLRQPARLNFDWQSAHQDGAGPLRGWVVPNFLDKSLAIFDASGVPLGSLVSVLKPVGDNSINSRVAFNWLPVPGSELPKTLTPFTTLVQAMSQDEGRAFLELVDVTLRKTDRRLPQPDAPPAVLLGRPLALVDASLGFEWDGLPAGCWNVTNNAWTFQTNDFENLSIPVRLGGITLPADGLIGYMPDATSFVAGFGAQKRLDSQTIKYDQDLTVPFAPASKAVTLLMDASARVHATTGLLPRYSLELPPEVGKHISLINEIYFNVAPVLGPRPPKDQPVVMPRPSDAFGQWSWATRPDLKPADRTWHNILPADDRAHFFEDIALSEGQLTLRLRPDQQTGENQS